MPSYNYVSIDSGEEFTLQHSMHDDVLTTHPETGEGIKRIFKSAPALHQKGLKKHVQVNYRSAAATACGCASNVALAQQMYSNSKETPRFGSLASMKKVTGGFSKSSGGGHSHSHSHSHGGGKCGHNH